MLQYQRRRVLFVSSIVGHIADWPTTVQLNNSPKPTPIWGRKESIVVPLTTFERVVYPGASDTQSGVSYQFMSVWEIVKARTNKAFLLIPGDVMNREM